MWDIIFFNSANKCNLIVQSYIRIHVVASKEGKIQSNVAVKIVIEEWVAKKATDFTFGRVHTKRIENMNPIICTKTMPAKYVQAFTQPALMQLEGLSRTTLWFLIPSFWLSLLLAGSSWYNPVPACPSTAPWNWGHTAFICVGVHCSVLCLVSGAMVADGWVRSRHKWRRAHQEQGVSQGDESGIVLQFPQLCNPPNCSPNTVPHSSIWWHIYNELTT